MVSTEQEKIAKAQARYWTLLQEAIKLSKQIQKELDAAPVNCNGDWGMVGNMGVNVIDLKNILDRLTENDEYGNAA